MPVVGRNFGADQVAVLARLVCDSGELDDCDGALLSCTFACDTVGGGGGGGAVEPYLTVE